MFSFYRPPVAAVRYVKEADLYGIYRYITEPRYAKAETDTLRGILNEEEHKHYKATHFAYCLFSGTFGTNRRNDGLQRHSGLICFDFDHLTNKDDVKRMLINDAHFETLLLFTSPSGSGLKWVIGIDLAQCTHEQWFNGVSNYLQSTYGLIADTACRNVARACFLPHDPECYLAPRLHRELVRIDQENSKAGALVALATSLNANIHIENYEQK